MASNQSPVGAICFKPAYIMAAVTPVIVESGRHAWFRPMTDFDVTGIPDDPPHGRSILWARASD